MTAITFEDLPIKKFLAQLKSLGSYTISAQADGLTFYFGIDTDNQFYTSAYSPNKRTKFAYKTSDYDLRVENNQFRAAHKAISKFKSEIQDILEAGQVIECQLEAKAETQFGNTYSKIILVRPVVGEATLAKSDTINKLLESIGNKKVQVKTKEMMSVNGEDIEEQDTITSWVVTKSKSVSGSGMLSSGKLKSILSKLEDYLSKQNDKANQHDLELSNFDILSVNLSQVPVKFRDVISKERDRLNNEVLTKFKFPIKTELLKAIEDNVGSQAALIHKGTESTWIASSEFKADGRFDTIPKRQLHGMVRTTDKDATIEDRGGIEGVFRQRVANLLGVPELQRPQSIGKVFKTFRGTTPRETAHAFASQLKEMSFSGVKTKILAMLKYSQEEAEKKMHEFKDNSNTFKQVTGGEEITYSQDDINSNLAYYAQAIKGYEDRQSEISRSKSFTDIILALYGDIIYRTHGAKSVSESLDVLDEARAGGLSKQQVDVMFDGVKNMDANDICEAYTATLLATQLLLRAQIKSAIPLIKDMKHATLKQAPSVGISQLNFWGTMVFSPFSSVVKAEFKKEVLTHLKKLSGRIVIGRIAKIHRTLSNGSLVQDWELQENNAHLIAMRLETRSSMINMAISGIRYWDDIPLSDKNTVIAKVFYNLQRHVHNSPLLTPLRQLATQILTQAAKERNTNMSTTSLADKTVNEEISFLQSLLLVNEAEMSSTTFNNAVVNATANIPSWADFGVPTDPSNAGPFSQKKFTGNNSLSNNNQQLIKFMNGKPIIRKKRDFIKKPKFSRPENQYHEDPSLVREDEGSGEGTGGPDSGTISSVSIAPFVDRLFDASKKAARKKKRILKRVIPGFSHVLTPADKVLALRDSLELFDDMCYAIVEWTDEDYSGDPETDEGFKYIKETYSLLPTETVSTLYENSTWPYVKLIGSKENLQKFLVVEYKANVEFITSAIKPLL